MSEDKAEAAALSDPDAQPLAEEALAKTTPVPRAKMLRRALGLTQEERRPARWAALRQNRWAASRPDRWAASRPTPIA